MGIRWSEIYNQLDWTKYRKDLGNRATWHMWFWQGFEYRFVVSSEDCHWPALKKTLKAHLQCNVVVVIEKPLVGISPVTETTT